MIDGYEADLTAIIANQDQYRLQRALALVRLPELVRAPEHIRGYGRIKARTTAEVAQRLEPPPQRLRHGGANTECAP